MPVSKHSFETTNTIAKKKKKNRSPIYLLFKLMKIKLKGVNVYGEGRGKCMTDTPEE